MEGLSTFWIIGIVFNVVMFCVAAWWVLRQSHFREGKEAGTPPVREQDE